MIQNLHYNTSELHPSKALGQVVASFATPQKLIKLVKHLVDVHKVMRLNIEKVGSHSYDPMDFAARVIALSTVPSYITDLAAFYFLVMCDAHPAVAASLQHDIHPMWAGNSHTLFKSKIVMVV